MSHAIPRKGPVQFLGRYRAPITQDLLASSTRSRLASAYSERLSRHRSLRANVQRVGGGTSREGIEPRLATPDRASAEEASFIKQWVHDTTSRQALFVQFDPAADPDRPALRW